MHIHGHQFLIEKSDGNSIVNNRIFKNTILVATGETWDVIFKAIIQVYGHFTAISHIMFLITLRMEQVGCSLP